MSLYFVGLANDLDSVKREMFVSIQQGMFYLDGEWLLYFYYITFVQSAKVFNFFLLFQESKAFEEIDLRKIIGMSKYARAVA